MSGSYMADSTCVTQVRVLVAALQPALFALLLCHASSAPEQCVGRGGGEGGLAGLGGLSLKHVLVQSSHSWPRCTFPCAVLPAVQRVPGWSRVSGRHLRHLCWQRDPGGRDSSGCAPDLPGVALPQHHVRLSRTATQHCACALHLLSRFPCRPACACSTAPPAHFAPLILLSPPAAFVRDLSPQCFVSCASTAFGLTSWTPTSCCHCGPLIEAPVRCTCASLPAHALCAACPSSTPSPP